MQYLKTRPLNPRTYDWDFSNIEIWPGFTLLKNKPTIWFYRGLPGSGKSTHAEKMTIELERYGGTFAIICKDDFRAVMPSAKESTIINYETQAICGAASAGVTNIYLPNTHFNNDHERRVRNLARTLGYEFEIVDFTFVPPGKCLRRNQVRDNREKVPDEVILSMFHKNIDCFKPWICDAYKKVFAEAHGKCYRDGLYKPVYVTDLDGTLALHNGRNPYDWRKANTDILNHKLAINLERAMRAGNHVYCLSARNDNAREITTAWLRDNLWWYQEPEAHLYMRSAGDDRRDWVVKLELMDLLIREKLVYPEVIFDDRNQVVEAWRMAGLTCWQVANGDF